EEEKRPRWGVRTSNPRKGRLPVLGGFDSHSLPPVLRPYMFLGVRQCSVVTTQHAEKTPYSRHSVFRCSLLCFMIHRSVCGYVCLGAGRNGGLLVPILSALRTVAVSVLIEPP